MFVTGQPKSLEGTWFLKSQVCRLLGGVEFLTLPLEPRLNLAGTRLTSDGQGVALEGTSGKAGPVGGSAVIPALLLLAGLMRPPKCLCLIQGDLVEGLVQVLFVKLVRDRAGAFLHRAAQRHFFPSLHLLIEQDGEPDLFHRGWKEREG